MNPRRRGFALLDILFCVMIAAVIVAVCGRLTKQVVRIYRDAPAALNSIQSSQQWQQLLRRDVWGARALRLNESGTFEITGDNRHARWRVEGKLLIREAGDAHSRWPLDEPLTFREQDGVWRIESTSASLALPRLSGGDQ